MAAAERVAKHRESCSHIWNPRPTLCIEQLASAVTSFVRAAATASKRDFVHSKLTPLCTWTLVSISGSLAFLPIFSVPFRPCSMFLSISVFFFVAFWFSLPFSFPLRSRLVSAPEKQAIEDADERCRRLVELNVQESCINLFANPVVQKKQATCAMPKIHGWAYDVENGLLQELKIDFKVRCRWLPLAYRLLPV